MFPSEGLESNVRVYSRSFPAEFARASGSELWSEGGGRYIDLFSGAGALNYGHNPTAVKDALLTYIESDGVTHSLDMHTVARTAFIDDFVNLVLRPRSMSYRLMFPGPTGTNAVEAALKLARKATGRTIVAGFTNGFHGMSLGALAVTGSRRKRNGAGVPLGDMERFPYCGYFGPGIDTMDLIEHLLDDPSSGFDPPAAFIVETVQGEGGVRAASIQWLRRLEALARRLGSLLVIDDIQAGCGRTGQFFSFEEAGISPDIICLSKSLSAYGLPFSLVLVKPELDVLDPGEHNGTFRGNNLAFVAARAALGYWGSGEFLLRMRQNVEFLDAWIKGVVASMYRSSVEPRGRGLLRGLAFADHQEAARVSGEAFRQGVLIEVSGGRDDVLKFLPPLTIEADLLAEALGRLEGIIRHAGSPPKPGKVALPPVAAAAQTAGVGVAASG